jgi:hypothetical protein
MGPPPKKVQEILDNYGIIALHAFFLVSISGSIVVVALLSRRPIYFTLQRFQTICLLGLLILALQSKTDKL